MKKLLYISLLMFFITLGYNFSYSQTDTVTNNLNTLKNKRVGSLVASLTEISFNEKGNMVSCGIGGALRFYDRFLLGIYGMGTLSGFKGSDLLGNPLYKNYQMNYSNGGIWIAAIKPLNKTVTVFSSAKIGYGAVFMYDKNSVIDYSKYRNNILIINPSFDIEFVLTEWMRVNFGIGIKLVRGFSSFRYSDGINITKVYKVKDFDALSTSFSIYIGNFYRDKK